MFTVPGSGFGITRLFRSFEVFWALLSEVSPNRSCACSVGCAQRCTAPDSLPQGKKALIHSRRYSDASHGAVSCFWLG